MSGSVLTLRNEIEIKVLVLMDSLAEAPIVEKLWLDERGRLATFRERLEGVRPPVARPDCVAIWKTPGKHPRVKIGQPVRYQDRQYLEYLRKTDWRPTPAHRPSCEELVIYGRWVVSIVELLPKRGVEIPEEVSSAAEELAPVMNAADAVARLGGFAGKWKTADDPW